MNNFGNLTVKGSKEFEKRLTSVLVNISDDLYTLVDKNLYESILLIGGYGRGEGGVIKLNGIESPHNNFDFVVISNNISPEESILLNDKCQYIFDSNTKKLGINVEFSIISKSKFNHIDPLVITYDMKYGHKVIAGNKEFLKNDSRFELHSIPSWDVRNLLVNRGTLLIINDLMLEKKELSTKETKIIIKHWIKAIIGYGDALLFFLNEYHYSYVEKQKRMKNKTEVSARFKDLYNDAMEFRFEPNYEKFQEKDLRLYHLFLKKELEKVHEQCEKLALDNTSLNSKTYINKAMEQYLYEHNSIKSNVKKVLSLVKEVPLIKELTLFETLKYKMVGINGMMPILFPFIAYSTKNHQIKSILNDFFKISNKKNTLKNQYLMYWKTYINSNFTREDFGI